MPEVDILIDRHLFEAWPAGLMADIEEVCQEVISDLFSVPRRAPEISWFCRERSRGTASLAVKVEWTVGPHGFSEETVQPLFVQKVRDVLHERLAQILFKPGYAASVDVWPRPQQDACWGRITRADWLAR